MSSRRNTQPNMFIYYNSMSYQTEMLQIPIESQSYKHYIFCLLDQLAGSKLGIFPCHWWFIVLRVNVVNVDHTASWIAAELGFKWAVIQNWINYEQISKARRVWPGWVEQLRRMLGWSSVEAGAGHLVWLWWFIQFWAALTLTVTQSRPLCSIIKFNALHFDVGFCVWWCL